MSGKIYANPEELKKFAVYLRSSADELQSRIKTLEVKKANLSEKIDRPISEKFNAEFQELTNSLKNFIEISRLTSQYLIIKAEKLEKYLNPYE